MAHMSQQTSREEEGTQARERDVVCGLMGRERGGAIVGDYSSSQLIDS